MDEAKKINLEDMGKLVIRIMLGGLLLFHGIGKVVHGVDMIQNMLVAHHYPAFAAYGAYLGEVVAPIFIILGFWTRLSSLVIAFDLAVAILLVRMPEMLTLAKSGGWALELEAFFFLSALALMLLGPGKLRLGGRGGIHG
ncbi:MAG: DoxX family protein [Treponema sp.]|nr:DoxX family protein [Treponema sp.]